ncbi:uncharacterized protein CXorf51A-like [Marmota flaviventris]|uniref:uncharacterized protein CXorf51A-like n=1 Tax=Marmota flaviventris TaxID=93162 RepID=UPI003A851329
MAKATKKSQKPNADMAQSTSSMKERKNMKTSYHHSRFGRGSKILKSTNKGKKTLQNNSSKRDSEKPSTSLKKSKKTKGTILFVHYHRLNEKLNREPEMENTPETSSISSDDLDSK